MIRRDLSLSVDLALGATAKFEPPDLTTGHALAREFTRPPAILMPIPLSTVHPPVDPAQRVGRAMRQLRRRRGISQRDLAARIDVDPSYISKIENAAVIPIPWHIIERLLQTLGVDVMDFCHSMGMLPPAMQVDLARSEAALDLVHAAARAHLDEQGWAHLLAAFWKYVHGRGSID